MFGKKKEDIVATVEQPLPETPPSFGDARKAVDKPRKNLVIPMPQELQPDPVYGFEPPRDETKFTGIGFAYPKPKQKTVEEAK